MKIKLRITDLGVRIQGQQIYHYRVFESNLFTRIRDTVVNNTHITAIAIPTETLPCSYSLIMKVETTSVLGSAIRLAVTSSLKEMINVIIHPAGILPDKRGSVIFLNI